MLYILKLDFIPMLLEGLALELYSFIDFLELLRECELVEEIKDCELIERGEVPVITVGN